VEIVGWGHTPFGKLADESLESLIVAAAQEALVSAGLAVWTVVRTFK
jgi:acetyl-CoA C-acetyltransferase